MSIMQMLLGAVQSGYNLLRSVRFRASASAYLNRTPSVAGNQQKWTWSGWVKRGQLGVLKQLFSVGSGTTTFQMYFNGSGGGASSVDGIELFANNSGTTALYYTSTAVRRDPASWYHIVLAIDTTQATAGNRVLLYVNGTSVTDITGVTVPAQNTNLAVNSTADHYIGQFGSANYFDGYLAEVNFIDGQALTPASFGSTNALTGVWQPAAYTGTYGTNGFYLKFTDNSTAAALGTDFSGNSNTWTTNNISVTAGVTYDSMTDVPTLTSATTANYCVLSPISGAFTSTTFSAGNLDMLVSSGVFNKGVAGTIAIPRSGKWYFELTLNSGAGTPGGVGVGFGAVSGKLYGDSADLTSLAWATDSAGNIYANSASIATATNWDTNGKICACTIDYVNNEIKFYVDNVLSYTLSGANFPTVDVTPLVHSGARGISINFGQRPFAYTPPTGFVALNTFNLPTSTIVKGNTVMDATLYTGDGTSPRSITNSAGFKPDFVWIKKRSAADGHILNNSVMGVGTGVSLYSNQTSAAGTFDQYGYLNAFNSNGFSTQSGSTDSLLVNANAATYVAWQWQAGGAAVTNTDGTISAQVSANPTAGFSVVVYTGNGTNGATVGHGLGVSPSMIIEKGRSTTYSWSVQGCGVMWTPATATLFLNTTNALNPGSGIAAPTSSVFTPSATLYANESGVSNIAYVFAEIAGFSKFGGYTGNGSTDGAFIYTGFRPRFVMVKQTNNVGNWIIWDTSRSTYNQMQLYLVPNSSSQELNNVLVSIDSVSNGFKCRTSDNDINGSGDSYIYMAFAENPFKNSLAR